MKTRKIVLLFSILCAVMLLNISLTYQGKLKLNFKVASLKEAQADMKEPNSFNHWELTGQGESQNDYFGWPSCYKREGYLSDPVYCSNPE